MHTDSASGTPLVAIPLGTMRSLARGSARRAEEQIRLVRQAGYDGGAELAQALEERARQAGDAKPEELPLEEFNALVAEFFERIGWGRVSTSSIHDVVAAVDIADCWEARLGRRSAIPCCHTVTGALSAFFSAFAPFTLAALEVECAATGSGHCRFLLGSPEVLSELYEHMARGQDYEAALDQLSETSASA